MSTSGASTEVAISRGDDMRRAYQGSDAGAKPARPYWRTVSAHA